MKPTHILIIDDEETIRHMLSLILKKEGYDVSTAENGEVALTIVEKKNIDIAICDVRMPKIGGMEFLEELEHRKIDLTVIVMSAFGNREVAIEAIKRGAYDYIDKPFKKDEVVLTIVKAEERLNLKRENSRLKSVHVFEGSFEGIIGKSEKMKSVYTTISKVAPYQSTVLISGESGTGKELVAAAVHNLSGRSNKTFIPVNCGAIPENLIESEFFGHVKGAFTDAHSDKKGLVEMADGGTLFLDEIGELPLNLQVKLLRFLQEGEIRPVGESLSKKVDVRIVAASLKDLGEEVKNGTFREDLYYRLNVIQISLPPLRGRTGDIPLLIEHFINVQNDRLGTTIKGVSPTAMKLMMQYSWPGNIRELQNAIERGVVLASSDLIEESGLPDRLKNANSPLSKIFDGDELSIKKMSAQLERILIKRALEQTGGNRTAASKLLEISHRALLYKIKDYNLK